VFSNAPIGVAGHSMGGGACHATNLDSTHEVHGSGGSCPCPANHQACTFLLTNCPPVSLRPAGLAAIQAGVHPHEIGAAVLIDPVDFTSQSRVGRAVLC